MNPLPLLLLLVGGLQLPESLVRSELPLREARNGGKDSRAAKISRFTGSLWVHSVYVRVYDGCIMVYHYYGYIMMSCGTTCYEGYRESSGFRWVQGKLEGGRHEGSY